METQVAGPYVIGVDAGGTTTRCVVMAPSGTIAGYGKGPGANRNSGGDAVTSLTTALRAALRDLDPSLVAGGVFGMAGAGAAGRAGAVHAATEAWHACGLTGAPTVVTDISVAFAAGTNAANGVVVFSGTGAGAAAISHGNIVRRADGYGWLVGDEGSAVWLGREAVRATLNAYDGRGAPTILAETVPRALFGDAMGEPAAMAGSMAGPIPAGVTATVSAGVSSGVAAAGRPTPAHAAVAERVRPASVGGDIAQAIIKEVYGQPPSALGRLGPLVCQAALDGDAVAWEITQEAARWLLMDVDAVTSALPETARDAAGRPDHPVVLAGSVLSGGPVADAVRAGLRERFATEPSQAGDGAIGAAGMALQRLGLAAVS
ncbi:MAG TPA: BadF/BadG/BcrA/BcrD ATPase family protein [Streptosporangiaceae bacterium]|nr:BadF/BadG/BcrA/BcrD ATPase family protein [Streptosporangiaceae bacterium]